MRVRLLDANETSTIDCIADRMHRTLVEVLDADRARELFDHQTLIGRVQWHLDEPRAAVFVASIDDQVVGHTIVRVEPEDHGDVGLFSTTYVLPEHRRAGVAGRLLDSGEAWMRGVGMSEFATYTAAGNEKLISLYAGRGYDIVVIDDEWVRPTLTTAGVTPAP